MDDDQEDVEGVSPFLESGISDSQQPRTSSDSNSKEIQTGGNISDVAKKKHKPLKKKKKKVDYPDENTMILDSEDHCLRHSFCVVNSLKEKGVKPFKPKGLPWSTGMLLYLPGQRPSYFKKSKQEQAEIIVKKKKKLKRKLKEKKRIMKSLREGDHQKLCNVLNTSQELMILMRIISMYMEKRKVERNLRLSEVQTDFETIPEEDEEEEEEDNAEGDEDEGEEDEGENAAGETTGGLPENFLETE